MKSAVNYAARINDPSLRWLFGLAEKFHRNFYNNTMPQSEIALRPARRSPFCTPDGGFDKNGRRLTGDAPTTPSR